VKQKAIEIALALLQLAEFQFLGLTDAGFLSLHQNMGWDTGAWFRRSHPHVAFVPKARFFK
jgi:hypothetical protein